ncbi:MAG: 3-isopropylmalate dehydratase small subunit [Terriglobales bacterium]
MEPVKTVTAKVVPLPLKDVDTDLIIPAQFLTSISREGFGKNLFSRLRQTDPEFPLNQPKYEGAQILVADSNFGCGSSREHAVWAIQGAGFKAVIAKSFADIFYNNAAKNGLLLVVLPEPVVDRLLLEGRSGALNVTIDLANQYVKLPLQNGEETFTFEFDQFRKHCLLNGLDDIDYIHSHTDQIRAFRTNQREQQFVCNTKRGAR